MYIHIGNDKMIADKDIIGVFDIEKTSVSVDTKKFLNTAAKRKCEVSCTEKLPRSFIVTFEKKNLDEKVYISRVCAATINLRCK